MGAPRDVIILGSTGSIGTQAIDVARRNPDRLRVTGLAALGSDPAMLAAQALELGVDVVAVTRPTSTEDLLLAFYAQAQRRGYSSGDYALPKILAGPEAATELAAYPCDVVLNGITGSIGLGPTMAALAAGRRVALANKESLIAGGDLVKAAAAPGQIVPVDSEHSALTQCLRGSGADEIRRLIVTASGGPFRGRTRDELAGVTPDEALAHPTWDMGRLVTTNSATLVNKGLEVIEAHLLFDVPFDSIDVVVHPQSVVHSMVEFVDGSTIATASPPDMRHAIALALSWPERIPDVAPACDWTTASTWEFFPLDHDAFPAVALARAAGERGGGAPAVYNAANEECVDAFHEGRLAFTGIVDTISAVLDEYSGTSITSNASIVSVEDVQTTERWARQRAREIIIPEERHQ